MGSRQSQDTQRAVLVLNGTGKTGRRVVERLQGRGVAVRAGSRSGEPPFHWQDPSTWLAALRGTDAAFISYYPDLAAPGAAEAIAAFSELAVQNGTRRLVLLSGRGEEEAQRSEAVLKESGADWTVVRCSWFMQNFSESYFLEPLLEGELALPADAIREPFVDADDVADVVVAALTDGRHAGQLYELTGPRLLRFDEAVAEIARASGETIRYAPLTIEQFAAGMADAGVPDDVVSLLGYLFTEVLDGRNAHLADGVQRALGRQPRDFSDYARDAAATGVWNRSRVAA